MTRPLPHRHDQPLALAYTQPRPTCQVPITSVPPRPREDDHPPAPPPRLRHTPPRRTPVCPNPVWAGGREGGAQLGEGQTPLGCAPVLSLLDVKPLPPDVGPVGMGAVMQEDIKVDLTSGHPLTAEAT
ncbi:hypothetical protein Hamer_G025239 [Homarus americanus]|uniref:Uncharacterized protein n=1 Tax=Homarus americanus TaxID=6706 RepID=A0A8J5K848_HOMAM|nr:hypothetical protein Hamer_G025239 [Homarus americanus]